MRVRHHISERVRVTPKAAFACDCKVSHRNAKHAVTRKANASGVVTHSIAFPMDYYRHLDAAFGRMNGNGNKLFYSNNCLLSAHKYTVMCRFDRSTGWGRTRAAEVNGFH